MVWNVADEKGDPLRNGCRRLMIKAMRNQSRAIHNLSSRITAGARPTADILVDELGVVRDHPDSQCVFGHGDYDSASD